jgi:hypothetical protein
MKKNNMKRKLLMSKMSMMMKLMIKIKMTMKMKWMRIMMAQVQDCKITSCKMMKMVMNKKWKKMQMMEPRRLITLKIHKTLAILLEVHLNPMTIFK